MLNRLGHRIFQLLPLPRPTKNKIKDFIRSRLLHNSSEYTFDDYKADLPSNVGTISEARMHAKELSFSTVDFPQISIIIPVFNQYIYTIQCLISLSNHISEYSFEVIVVDDCSTDYTIDVLPQIEGVHFLRNTQNMGFLRSCNVGAENARAEYLLFLNNDTVVHKGWLDNLRRTFHEHDRVGIAGSKLIYADGRLQEAGGVIWDDASGWNVGRLDHPEHPYFNYLRDVDYVSGASLMIPRHLFNELGKFDLEFVPAYYEDTSLCFSAREAGFRVLYQPLSVVTHFEGVTSGTDINDGVKRYQVVNQEKFRSKWAGDLVNHLPNGTTPERARDRRPKKHVLIVDAITPTPDEDSGSIDMFNLIKILIQEGYRVHFVPSSNMAHCGEATKDLLRLGVVCVYAPFFKSLRHYLEDCKIDFSLVILARVGVAFEAISVIDEIMPDVPRIFYTVDLHHLRELRAAKISNDAERLIRAKELRKQEYSIMHRANTTIVLSEVEAALLEKSEVNGVEVLPLIREIKTDHINGFEERDGVGFIGGYRHEPNVEAVVWLLDRIWPLVQSARKTRGLEPIPLYIGGSNMPPKLASKIETVESVINLGFIENLNEFFSGLRLTIAPLKSGAGLKGKVAESWSHGVPVIGSNMAFEGLPTRSGLGKLIMQAESPNGIADLVLENYDDSTRWRARSALGREYAAATFGIINIKEKFRKIVERTEARAASQNQKYRVIK